MRRKLELNGGFDLYYPLGTVVYDFLIWRANPRVLYTRKYNEDRYNLDSIYAEGRIPISKLFPNSAQA